MIKVKNNKNSIKEEALKIEEAIFLNAAHILLADFPLRVQEITKKRFGFFSEKKETLEKIGNDHGVTRERVRQIMSDTVKKILKNRDATSFVEIESQIVFAIEEKFGIIKKSELIKKLTKDNKKEANALMFLSFCSDKIIEVTDKEIKETLLTKKEALERAKEVRNLAREILEKEKKLLTDKEISEKIIKKSGQKFSVHEVLSYLSVLDEIKKNRFGKWGVSHWTEVNPKGTREKIYTILKEKKKPLHFTEIAKIMDEFGLSKKKAHPQTIHNELIKNEIFILIGRGIYALEEWGYNEGTVRDVLVEIFQKNVRPMEKEEIIKEVMKSRKVKETTILINLGDRNLFSKKENVYFLAKK